MRTTIDLDTDILQAARERARREGKSMGRVISDLARAGLSAFNEAPTARTPNAIYGFRPFAKRGGIVSNELIDKLREDDVY